MRFTGEISFFTFFGQAMQNDEMNSNSSQPTYAQIIVASSVGLIFAACLHYRIRKLRDEKIIPRKRISDNGQVLSIEKFSHYVARQMGFKDRRECPHLCKLASEYIKKTEGCEEEMYAFFASEPDVDSLFIKLVEEFERCILSYFAFHWRHTSFMLTQVLGAEEPKKKLKTIVMAATREQRVERVTKNLKVARVFTTLVEEMKAIGLVTNDDSQCTNVMVPMAHSDRSPVLLLMGGGMGAGKSTVLKDILKEPFWAGASENAVVIEADAFKESDVIYKALSSRGHHDLLQTAELVHQSSTDAASSLLVTALNEGRDVIMDGTLSWLPFVVQTINMARNVHRRRYRMGPGYRVEDNGEVIENYWEQMDEDQEQDGDHKRRPYRVELVGVVCDSYLACIFDQKENTTMKYESEVQQAGLSVAGSTYVQLLACPTWRINNRDASLSFRIGIHSTLIPSSSASFISHATASSSFLSHEYASYDFTKSSAT